MVRHRAPLGLTAALIISLFTEAGCGADRVEDPSAPDVPGDHAAVLATPAPIPPARLCTSTIDADGLLCSVCADAPTAAPECLAARCTIDNHCLTCTDPKGRIGTDCSKDYNGYIGAAYGGSPNGEFSFATCTFTWGEPKITGTTCNYPGGDTCVVEEYDEGSCMQCTYPDGSGAGVCGTGDNPLYDPLINRPDDLPGPGACISDLRPDGKVQCTTCVHGDLSATRSCRYPGIVDCDLSNPEDEAAGCVGRCTFEDGHQERMCDSPRGLHPVPLP
jgi:hypothetical protein